MLSGIEGDKSGSNVEGRFFRELDEDFSESLGTSLPTATDFTLTTTMAERVDEEEEEEEDDTDENQNKVCRARGLMCARLFEM